MLEDRLRRVVAVLVGLLMLTGGIAPSEAATIASSDLQVLPDHPRELPSAHDLLGASDEYVLHAIHPTYDGLTHQTILRVADGSTAWADLRPSADAWGRSLAGGYYVEKVGGQSPWPDLVRFFDVESHALAGEIALLENETLVGVGAGWIVVTRPGSTYPTSFLVVRRVDGSTAELPEAVVTQTPLLAGFEDQKAWVNPGPAGPLYEIDVTAGTVAAVPAPEGFVWDVALVGPTHLFNVDDLDNGHVTVTAIDRTTNAVTTTDLVMGLVGGYPPVMLTRGAGLAVYHHVGDRDGRLWVIDLDAGELGALLHEDLSDVRSAGPGVIALVKVDSVPEEILVDSGASPTTVGSFPVVPEQAAQVAFDGTVRATWGAARTTWQLDPDVAEPTWSPTPWTDRQRVTTAGGTTLVNELDENFVPTDQWHLSWAGGQRDIQGWGLRLGHGGHLLTRYADEGGSETVVERTTTGEVVATAGPYGAAVDGTWVWTWSTATELRGVDVDDPQAPARTVAYTGQQMRLQDVRGRYLAIKNSSWFMVVVDTLGVVEPWTIPGSASTVGPVQLGNGFVAWTQATYTPQTGTRTVTSVADLTASHTTRELVDPATGRAPVTYAVDEGGSAALVYAERGRPVVVRLPWLGTAPTVLDVTAPTATLKALPSYSWSAKTTVTWTATDHQSGVVASDLRVRSATWKGSFGAAKVITTSKTAAQVSTPVGSTHCFAVRARDAVGNVGAWSPERCTAIPVDDATATKSSGWGRSYSSAYYRGSTLRSTKVGSSMTLSNVKARRIALVVSTGPGNGKIAVYWRGVKVGTWSLASTTTKHRKLIPIKVWGSVNTGSLTVKVVTDGKVVRVDGIGIGQF